MAHATRFSMVPVLTVYCVALLAPLPAAATDDAMQAAAHFASAGRYQEAIKLYETVIAQNRLAAPEALYQKGHCYRLQADYEQALKCWDTLLRRNRFSGENAKVLLSVASTYAFSMDRLNDGRQAYELFFKQFPASDLMPEARYQYAGTFLVEEDYDTAKHLLEEFLSAWPRSSFAGQARSALSRCKEGLRRVADERARQQRRKEQQNERDAQRETWSKTKVQLEEAEAFFLAGRIEEALRGYQRITRGFTSHEHEQALYRIGQCYRHLGNYRNALKAWDDVLRVPRLFAAGEYGANALVAAADTLLDDLDDVAGALKRYQAALAQSPQTDRLAHVYAQMAICHLLEGDPTRAKDLLSRALAERPPQDPDAPPDGWERLLQACDQPDAFLPDYERKRTASRVAREMRRADLYFTAKEYERAAQAYESVVKKRRHGAEEAAYALMQAARCYNQLSRYELALKRYEGFLGRYTHVN